jgi:hypothetical protein
MITTSGYSGWLDNPNSQVFVGESVTVNGLVACQLEHLGRWLDMPFRRCRLHEL